MIMFQFKKRQMFWRHLLGKYVCTFSEENRHVTVLTNETLEAFPTENMGGLKYNSACVNFIHVYKAQDNIPCANSR